MSRLSRNRLCILAFAAGFSVITAGIAQAQTRPAKQGNRHTAAASAADRGGVASRSAGVVGARALLNRKADLGITDDQARLLDVIARRYDDQDKMLRDDNARAASRAAEQKEVNGILTDDQREKIRAAAPTPALPAPGDQARRN